MCPSCKQLALVADGIRQGCWRLACAVDMHWALKQVQQGTCGPHWLEECHHELHNILSTLKQTVLASFPGCRPQVLQRASDASARQNKLIMWA